MTDQQFFYGLVNLAVWVTIIFVAVSLVLGSAFVYRVIVEWLGARLARWDSAHLRDDANLHEVYVDRDVRRWRDRDAA